MKHAQLEGPKGPIKENIMIVDPSEALLIHDAMKAYCEANPRKRKAKKLLEELELVSMFY